MQAEQPNSGSPTPLEIRAAVDDLYLRLRLLKDNRTEEALVNILAAAGRLKALGFNPIIFKNWKGIEAYSTRFAAPEKPEPKPHKVELIPPPQFTHDETVVAAKLVRFRLHCDGTHAYPADAIDYCIECDYMGCSAHFSQHLKEAHGGTTTTKSSPIANAG